MMSGLRLTVGMATFDDFDGVYFTVTSLMIHHADVMANAEVVVIDNNPSSREGKTVRDWVENRVPHGRYYAFEGSGGTAQARNEVFKRASGEFVLCIDCHVLLVPDALNRLMDYYRQHSDSHDLLCGPLLMDSGRLAATHQRPQWSSGAYGVWATDDRGRQLTAEPFEIWQQGMGLFSCRKEAWVGFHPEFRGFGGCETYVMEKFRKNGGRVLCCPWLRWTHRFARPRGVPYQLQMEDRIRNYTIGFTELGLDLEPVREHFGLQTNPSKEDSAAAPIQKSRRQTLGKNCERTDSGSAEGRKLAVVGSEKYGGVQMRGRLLAKHAGCKLISPNQVSGMAHRETIFAIKGGFCEQTIRRQCDRLIFDPLDVFAESRGDSNPADYWRAYYRKMAFDDIIATSPACYDVMRDALPNAVRVHLVPHQCDAKIQSDWRNPKGPVVYAGLSAFIKSRQSEIKEACASIGKEFRIGHSCDVLRNASAALALRLPPYDTALNRFCKPQIKLENAAAAGLPVVATDDPATVSLHPDADTVPVDFSVPQLADILKQVIDKPGLKNTFTNQDFVNKVDSLLRKQRVVVYTAIFGGYDQLLEPRERLPGVEYVCFTDNPWLKSNVWEIRHCPVSEDPLVDAKRYKILGHEFLNCDVSLYIDGRIELCRLNGAIEQLSADLGLVRHPNRNCIYEEAAHCKRQRRGDPSRIDDAISRYRQEGHPDAYGLWRGGIILRRHNAAIREFNRTWWAEVMQGTSRDQIVLPVVLRRLGTAFINLPNDMPLCLVRNHVKVTGR